MSDHSIPDLYEKLERIEKLLLNQRGLRTTELDAKIAASSEVKLSFISPCFNEVVNLNNLYSRIERACAAHGIENFEVVWIENGSSDGSLTLMSELAAADPRIKVLQLSRNFGYQGAIACGLAYATGDYIAILDGDLQDPPELLPEMLKFAQQNNFEVVYGVRTKRQEHIFKRLAYSAFYRIWNYTAEIDVPLDAGDFCVMSRKVADAINSMPERQRFNRGLRAWVGFRQAGFAYARDARAEGESKFNLRGMIQLALDGLISYSIVPLRTATITGIGIAFTALVLGVVQGFARLLAYHEGTTFSGVLPPGITQVSLVMIGLFGVQIFLMGILGEYVGRIYGEVKDRPLFLVKSQIGFNVQRPQALKKPIA